MNLTGLGALAPWLVYAPFPWMRPNYQRPFHGKNAKRSAGWTRHIAKEVARRRALRRASHARRGQKGRRHGRR